MSGAVATVTATGAEIGYTLDGSDPRYSAGALALTSGGTVTLKDGEVLRCYAHAEGKYPSGLAEQAYSA